MPNLVILMGLPGCGKSTATKDLFDLKYAVVSTDALRVKMYGSLKAAHEAKANQVVFEKAHRATEEFLVHNVDVVFDATSLTRSSRDDLRKIAAKHDATVIGIFFANREEALVNNLRRDEDAIVPEKAMEYMLVKYMDSIRDISHEHFDRLIRIHSIQGSHDLSRL